MGTRTRWISIGLIGLVLRSTEAQAAPVPDRAWGTYVASPSGSSSGGPYVAVDAAGSIYVAGRTLLGDNGVATPGAHKSNPQDWDAFLMKFDPAGDVVWGTYFGGQAYDGAEAIALADDRVYICGRTQSSEGIASPGAFQTVNNSPIPYFAAAFSTDGVWLWGTYVNNGINSSAKCGIVGGPQNHIVMAATTGDGGNLATPGTHQAVAAGVDEVFVLKLGPKGERLWGTYYGGTGNDRSENVARDAFAKIYVGGWTLSANGIATPGVHQEIFGGGSDLFVARFTDVGTLEWGTYMGGANAENAHGLAVHPSGGVVLTGQSSSVGLATPGAYQGTLGGKTDSVVVRFNNVGKRIWSTYFGGAENDFARAVTVDGLGSIYLGGVTHSADKIATMNAFQPAYQGLQDAFVAKFDGGGALQWATYYGGSQADSTVAIAVRSAGDVIIGGGSTSADGIATPDGFQAIKLGAHSDPYMAALFDLPAKACVLPQDCGSGFCVDGRCCDTACGGGVNDCQACSTAAGAAVDGHCGPSAPGKPCRASQGPCDPVETCTDASRECPDDLALPDGADCDGGTCTDGICVPNGGSTGTGTATSTSDDTSVGSSDGTQAGTSEGSTGMSSTTGPGPDTGTTSATGSDTTGAAPTSTATSTTGLDPSVTGTAADPTSGATSTMASATADPGSSSGDSAGGGGTSLDGCGCKGSAPPTAGGLVLSLALLARRRRSTRLLARFEKERA